jgi:hypothetical protein
MLEHHLFVKQWLLTLEVLSLLSHAMIVDRIVVNMMILSFKKQYFKEIDIKFEKESNTSEIVRCHETILDM